MPLRFRHALALAPLAAVLGAIAPAAGAAGEPYVSIKGYDEPSTPAKYDRVYVRKFGRASAKRVLVLTPGFVGGSGDFTLVARELIKRVPGLQVWAVDRRSNALEDVSHFKSSTSTDSAYDYYLGLHFKQVDGARDAPFARNWGMKVQLEDLRRVILAAKKGGRKVTLGGHSLGGSTTVAYASWDFNGQAGYKDVDGLILIDGGLLGSFVDSADLQQARQRKAAIDSGEPFSVLLPGLPPWSAGVFAEVGGMLAKREPNAVSRAQTYFALPDVFKPPFPVTNEALLAHAFDANTVPKGLELLEVHAGRLADSGDPRPWRNGELTPAQNVASTFFQEPGNAVEWYFPDRLRLDTDGMSPLKRGPVTNLLGLRPYHVAQVNRPLYAYETNLTKGNVLKGARAFVRRSKVPRATYVDDPGAGHLDPLTAAPARNRFLKTVVPFLKSLSR